MFREGTCPKCRKQIQVPDDQERILCMYCGAEILVDAALGIREQTDPERYERSRTQALEELKKVIRTCQRPMEDFKRDRYQSVFEAYCAGVRSMLTAMEYVYRQEEDPEKWILSLTEELIGEARADLQGCGSRIRQNQRKLDLNFQVSIYLIPAVLQYPAEFSEPFAKSVVEAWNREFDASIGMATYEQISGGFRRKLCYITTAVCESLGKGPDCYELQLLKNYRDEYLERTPEGHALVEEYYDLAPTIVKRIEREPDRKRLYEELYKNYLTPCIQNLEAGELKACQEGYERMVLALRKRYMN